MIFTIKIKNIRKIEEETGVSVEIDDDGILTLGSTEEDSLAAAKEMVEKSGQRGVPVILVEGHKKPIIGFDRDELEEALGL